MNNPAIIEYLISLMPQATVACDECGIEREAVDCVIRSEKTFCSERCADRNLAQMIKPQPKGVELDGWQI